MDEGLWMSGSGMGGLLRIAADRGELDPHPRAELPRFLGRAKGGGGQNAPKRKTSRGWPVGNCFSRPSESCFRGGQLGEILGSEKWNGGGGGQKVPR